MQSFTATLNHRFNDDWSVRNVTRVYDYALDRYNTLSSGTTDPVTMTVGRSRAFILRANSRRVSKTRCPQVRHTNPISAPKRTTSHSKPPQGWALRNFTRSPSDISGSISLL